MRQDTAQRKTIKTAALIAAIFFTAAAHAEPLIRFGRLQVKPEAVSLYQNAIKTDIDISIKEEPNAHTMAAMAETADPASFYVMEIYTDADWEQSHRQTKQYQDFAAATQDIYADKELIEITPEFIGERVQPFALGGSYALKMSRYADIKPADAHRLRRHFARRVNSLRDPVAAIYAARLQQKPTEWVVIEAYLDQAALKRARSQTRLLPTPKSVRLLDGGILMNKGGFWFEQR